MTTNARTPLLLGIALAFALPLLGACHRDAAPPAGQAPDATKGAPQTALGKSVDAAMRKAREKLQTSDLDVGNGPDIQIGEGRHFRFGDRDGKHPRAVITPQGDFIVDGRKIATTPEQRALLLQYRKEVITVAEAGMALGVQGADLAGKALGETFTGLLHGDTDGIEKRMEAEGRRIEAEARKLCGQLTPMLQTQQQLAASLPEFKPYARMTREDIDDCMKDDGAPATDTDRARIREEIRQEIRAEVRDGLRSSLRRDSDARQTTDAAEEADAAAAR